MMDLNEFKCEVCPKKLLTTQMLKDIEKDILDDLYTEKRGFTKEDDFDLACTVVEKVFEGAGLKGGEPDGYCTNKY